ncbi:MAG TPA: hypothetical protein PLP19_08055 [bacterium]|nr:hypothetical protein [bacterium]HPN43425.1 hypothetical protein [bacterium]
MSYLFLVLLVIIGVYIIAPYLNRHKSVAVAGTKQQKLSALQYRRQLISISLAELDFDYRMGKLTEQDREQAMQELHSELGNIEKRLAQLGNAQTAAVKEKLEKEIAARKKQINSGKK